MCYRFYIFRFLWVNLFWKYGLWLVKIPILLLFNYRNLLGEEKQKMWHWLWQFFNPYEQDPQVFFIAPSHLEDYLLAWFSDLNLSWKVSWVCWKAESALTPWKTPRLCASTISEWNKKFRPQLENYIPEAHSTPFLQPDIPSYFRHQNHIAWEVVPIL